MIKFILISLLILSLIFLLIKFLKNPHLKTSHLFILFVIAVIIYFIYTGKISYLLAFLRNILPNLLKLFGV
jgi:Ca2+/Na+ antiporter|tara:strand:- start:371 stop:583 length:213 start_codon:yes stop_codon:yes gene_type:complete